jgi:hypothetical protein
MAKACRVFVEELLCRIVAVSNEAGSKPVPVHTAYRRHLVQVDGIESYEDEATKIFFLMPEYLMKVRIVEVLQSPFKSFYFYL